jgi:hypothetical protein
MHVINWYLVTTISLVYMLTSHMICQVTAETSGLLQQPQSQTDENLSLDHSFLKCIAEGNCGLENKCSFKLYGELSPPPPPPQQQQPTPPTTTTNSNTVVVTGHLMKLKNRMPFGIVYFWDILGLELPIGSNPIDRYHGVYCGANEAIYVDTKHFGEHTVRLYVSTNGNHIGLLQNPVNISSLENIQTIITSNIECPRYQACRLLDSVCYMASYNQDCIKYRQVCKNFNNDADVLAKESCIPECAYTYYADEFPDFKEMNPSLVVKCLKVGIDMNEHFLDGGCNTGTLAGLSVALVLSIACIVIISCLACQYKHSLKKQTNILSSSSTMDDTNIFGGNEGIQYGYT